MRGILSIVLAISLLASFAASQESRPAGPKVSVPTFHNENCPVMGKPVNPKLFVDTPHGRIYMCCKGCAKKIGADPEAMYKKAYPAAKAAGNKVCPSSGEALEANHATVSIQGWEIGLCCGGCAKAVLENAQVILARLANPKVTDVGNTTDPVTGKAVQNDVFCLIGDDLVHLSSEDSVEAVMKDPKKALDAAKAQKKSDAKDGEKKGGPHGSCCGDAKSGAEGGSCCSGGKAETRPAK